MQNVLSYIASGVLSGSVSHAYHATPRIGTSSSGSLSFLCNIKMEF